MANYDLGLATGLSNDEIANAITSVNGLTQKEFTPVHSIMHSQDISAGSAGATYLMMVMIPVNYSSVRIGYHHVGGSGGVVGGKCIVASTDDIGDLSYNSGTAEGRRFIVPTKNGVDYNDISFNGWHNVTWGGASEFNIPDLGSGMINTQWSDLIDLQSVPLLGGVFEGYNALLVRVFDGSAARSATTNWTGQTLPQYLIDAGSNIMMNASRGGGDKVTDPSTWGLQNTPSFSTSGDLPLSIEAYTSDNTHKSVLCVGDSRVGQASSSESDTGYRTLAWRLQRDINLASTPCNTVVAAKGGYTTDEYYELGMNYLSDGIATDALYLIYSINDGIPTVEVMANAKAKCLRFIKRCNELSITPLLMTSFPRGTGYTAGQLLMLADLEEFAANTGYKVLSPLTEYGDANGVWVGGVDEDDDHMTPAGYDDLSSKITALLLE